jgi:CRP-like cAMP-binding protein
MIQAYFLRSGVVAYVGATTLGGSIARAVVGREGMAGAYPTLGEGEVACHLVVQVGGRALRAPLDEVRRRVLACGDLHSLVLRRLQSLTMQFAQSGVCNRFHTARQRLARWLLLTLERTDTTSLGLTHEFMAQMVGGPRPAVTQAAGELRSVGATEYQRATLTVIDRQRLEREACECYAVRHVRATA